MKQSLVVERGSEIEPPSRGRYYRHRKLTKQNSPTSALGMRTRQVRHLRKRSCVSTPPYLLPSWKLLLPPSKTLAQRRKKSMAHQLRRRKSNGGSHAHATCHQTLSHYSPGAVGQPRSGSACLRLDISIACAGDCDLIGTPPTLS